MFVPVVHAQDDEFDEPGGSDTADAAETEEELIELEGVDNYVRESWYIQGGFSRGSDLKFEDKIEQNIDRAVSPPPSVFLADPNFVNPGVDYGAPGLLISIGPVDVSDSNGFDFRVGRRLAPNVAIEAQLEYHNFKTSIEDWARIETKTYAFTINVKVPILTGRIQPYGLLGGGFIYADPNVAYPIEDIRPSRNSSDPSKYNEIVDARNFGGLFRFAGGVDAYINDNVYVMAEVGLVSSQGEDTDDIRYISYIFGVGYRF
jgi:opacity protein-like surface antigen